LSETHQELDRAAAPPQFAHPAEATFAQILDYYGVEWEYEPRTFPLEWDSEGNVTVAFSPDFYLPQQELYIELTTLRPQLIRHKNRKMRRMAELYPEVNVKLLKRQDIRELLVKFGLDQEAGRLVGTDAQE
jgi:hypoxanthine phosphoribosyltransferase